MEGCAEVVGGLAEARSVHLLIEPPEPPIRIGADERRATQVACNLLGNAVKFTPAGGSVLFKARLKGREVVFSVQDDGPGIAPEFRERIFEQFFRVHNDQEGTGLGLPLAKQPLELQADESGWTVRQGAALSFALRCLCIAVARSASRWQAGVLRPIPSAAGEAAW
jgi:signal transduction histidine kinase